MCGRSAADSRATCAGSTGGSSLRHKQTHNMQTLVAQQANHAKAIKAKQDCAAYVDCSFDSLDSLTAAICFLCDQKQSTRRPISFRSPCTHARTMTDSITGLN